MAVADYALATSAAAHGGDRRDHAVAYARYQSAVDAYAEAKVAAMREARRIVIRLTNELAHEIGHRQKEHNGRPCASCSGGERLIAEARAWVSTLSIPRAALAESAGPAPSAEAE